MRRKSIFVVAAAAAAIAIAAAALLLTQGTARRQASSTGQPSKPLPAEAMLTGKIRAAHVVPVSAPIEGHVEEILVEVGQEVYEGELLARIKNAGLQTAQEMAAADQQRAEAKLRSLESSLLAARLEASRARAEASRVRDNFEQAEKHHARQQMLYREGAAAKLAYERAAREFNSARLEMEAVEELARQAENRVTTLMTDIEIARRLLDDKTKALEEAKQNLAAAEVHSPVDGIVVARGRQVGDPVSPQVRDLFQIAVDLSLLEVVVEPEPPLLNRIRRGQPALVEVVEGPIGGIPARVKEIKGELVIVEFANPSPEVKPGLTAGVRIRLAEPLPGSEPR